MYENTYPSLRFEKTMAFLQRHISKDAKILDLGIRNPLSDIMHKAGYRVSNTQGEDLDDDQSALQDTSFNVVTAFEIFEHLLNPYTVLKQVQAQKIVISVPLRLWFAHAYRSKTDMRDRHYHEFEDWQLDWLLEKTGFRIVAREKWAHPVKKIGLRPLLRTITPRYYMVLAEKI